jgi:hypothetical protein
MDAAIDRETDRLGADLQAERVYLSPTELIAFSLSGAGGETLRRAAGPRHGASKSTAGA